MVGVGESVGIEVPVGLGVGMLVLVGVGAGVDVALGPDTTKMKPVKVPVEPTVVVDVVAAPAVPDPVVVDLVVDEELPNPSEVARNRRVPFCIRESKSMTWAVVPVTLSVMSTV